ncbi:hypothetical protein A3K69_06710 [Candidatus Bathyarchaeota archaeon RBG_16_57_9]|nr:MAG: hypothetical protein A3K69_06710 [Candidatus Bathyarchaeota archaeon RBG_16_57_9]
MRKTLAFAVGVLTVLGMGPVLLHPSLQAIGLWLSPVLGTEVYTVFTVFHLLTGDPLKYVAVGLLWLVVAFVGGLVVRRRLGAALTMLSVWLVMVPVLAISILGLAMNVGVLGESHSGSPLSLIPPIPPGLTLTSLLETPTVGETLNQVISGGLNNLSQDDVMIQLEEAAYSMGAWFFMRPVIMILGSLIGVEAGLLLERRGLFALPRSVSGALKAFTVALLILGSNSPRSSAQIIDASDGIYVENMLGLSDRQGRTLVVEAFAATTDRRPSHANLVAHVLVSQQVDVDILVGAMNLTIDYDVASLVNLAPSTLLITVYVDTPVEEARVDAAQMAAAAAERYGWAFRFMGAFEAPEMKFNGTSLPRLVVAVSYSDIGVEEAAPFFLEGFVERGGLAQAVSGALSSGALIPGASGSSPETTLLAAGFINPGPILDRVQLPSYPEELDELLAIVRSGSLDVAIGAHIWRDGVSADAGGFTLDLSSLLDVQAVSLSPAADLSLITLVTPNNTRVGDLTPNIRVTTDQPEESYILSLYTHLLEGLGIMEVTTDETPGPGALRASTSLPLPPWIEIEKMLDGYTMGPGKTVRVTVTATNHGSRAAENVVLRDTGIADVYGTVTVTGETFKAATSLAPGQSVALSYSVTARNPGTYTLMPAMLTYSYGGASYSEVSERYILGSGPPGIMDILGALRLDTILIIDLVTDGGGRAATDVLLAAAGLLVLLNLALSLRRAKLGATTQPAVATAQQPP